MITLTEATEIANKFIHDMELHPLLHMESMEVGLYEGSGGYVYWVQVPGRVGIGQPENEDLDLSFTIDPTTGEVSYMPSL